MFTLSSTYLCGYDGSTHAARACPGPGRTTGVGVPHTGGGWLTHHQPGGDWLYGLDMSIHPAWRGRGGARLLYRARHCLVRHLGLRGQLTVGMTGGYGALRDQFSCEDYYRQWLDGLRTDPTLTPQQKIGFGPLALIPDYLDDPVCGNFGVLLRLDTDQEVRPAARTGTRHDPHRTRRRHTGTGHRAQRNKWASIPAA